MILFLVFSLIFNFKASVDAAVISGLWGADRPVYFLLAGDSTTAPKGGWGDGFLSTTVAKGSAGRNYGHGGATTMSFRAGGDWANVVKDIGTYKDKYDVYVTIQFGHNDQKERNGVTLDQYTTNLQNFAAEVAKAGATPVLLTPLTRRVFSNGKVVQNLANERARTIAAAESRNYRWIDLNKASEDYVNKIGQDAASKYNFEPNDWTHLNDYGGIVFARLVSDLLVRRIPQLREVTVRNETLSRALERGVPA